MPSSILPSTEKLDSKISKLNCAAILAAAGASQRFASEVSIGIKNKLFAELKGVSVLLRSAQALAAIASFTKIIVLSNRDNFEQIKAMLSFDPRFEVTLGGNSRQESVRLGLEALQAVAPQIVLIHDAARCLVSQALLKQALLAAAEYSAVTAALPLSDSIHEVKSDRILSRALERTHLCSVQTPQAFRFDLIYQAHQKALKAGLTVTDDASLVENVKCIDGEPCNIKITLAQDLELAQFYLNIRQ